MIEIYSGEELYHLVVRAADFKEGRVDIIQPHNFIQCSMLKLKNGQTFKPHKHIYKQGPSRIIAQESWVVIQGKVRAIFYDENNKVIRKAPLFAGDASFTLKGGHTYEILEDNTLVYEFKTGPYTGQENDKEFI